MLYKAIVAVCSKILTKHSMQSVYHVEFLKVNLLKTKSNLLYIRNQSVPRSKHFPLRL